MVVVVVVENKPIIPGERSTHTLDPTMMNEWIFISQSSCGVGSSFEETAPCVSLTSPPSSLLHAFHPPTKLCGPIGELHLRPQG
eukprot:4072207-Pyramimonas_sp.AAC.1